MIDYPLHPQQTHAEPLYCQIPLEEYESIKKENQELKEANKKLEKAIKEEQWRKFSEEKPKHHQYVLVLLNNNRVAECNTELRRWDEGLKFDVEIQDLYLLWRPLPKEPEK